MNREIKFRGWDKKESKWLFAYETLGGFSLTGEVVLMGALSSLSLEKLFNEVEIMQFTGLLDKNGKEIYEGDIMKWGEGKSVVVVYEDFGYTLKFSNGNTSGNWVHLSQREIIGNIYENPELLKQTA